MKDLYFVEMDSTLGGFYTLGAYSTLEKAKDRIASIASLTLDEMVDSADSADDRCEKLADLAERIRRLAKNED